MKRHRLTIKSDSFLKPFVTGHNIYLLNMYFKGLKEDEKI